MTDFVRCVEKKIVIPNSCARVCAPADKRSRVGLKKKKKSQNIVNNNKSSVHRGFARRNNTVSVSSSAFSALLRCWHAFSTAAASSLIFLPRSARPTRSDAPTRCAALPYCTAVAITRVSVYTVRIVVSRLRDDW